MAAFPLPRPTGALVDLPPVDVDGAQFRVSCAPELARFAIPVLDRWIWRHEREPAAGGQATGVGFSIYWIRQRGPGQFQVQTSDYDRADEPDDLVENLTDDLSAALWIEGSQDDVLQRTNVEGTPLSFTDEVLIEKAALDVMDDHPEQPLLLERLHSWDEDESGWIVSVPGTTSRRARRTVPIIAGLLVSAAPYLIPYLRLPGGSLVEIADRAPRGVWWTSQRDLDAAGVKRAGDAFDRLVRGGVSKQLLGAGGNGTGAGRQQTGPAGQPASGPQASAAAPPTSAPSAPGPAPRGGQHEREEEVATIGSMLPIPQDPRITFEEQQDGVRLVAKTAPQLDQIARAMMGFFFERGRDEMRDGASIQVGYNIFWLQQIGQSDFQITAPDFSDPAQYRSRRTDDLTAALWAHGMQFIVTRAAAAQGDVTYLSDEVSVQQAVIDDLMSDAQGNLMMLERLPLSDDQRFFNDGQRRSGWMVSKPGPALPDEKRQLRNVDAGSLMALAPMLIPYLMLPDDAMVVLNGEDLVEVRLLDAAKLDAAITANPQAKLADLLAGAGVSRLVLRGRRD